MLNSVGFSSCILLYLSGHYTSPWKEIETIKDLNETFPHYLISVFLSRVPKRKAFELGKIYYL